MLPSHVFSTRNEDQAATYCRLSISIGQTLVNGFTAGSEVIFEPGCYVCDAGFKIFSRTNLCRISAFIVTCDAGGYPSQCGTQNYLESSSSAGRQTETSREAVKLSTIHGMFLPGSGAA